MKMICTLRHPLSKFNVNFYINEGKRQIRAGSEGRKDCHHEELE